MSVIGAPHVPTPKGAPSLELIGFSKHFGALAALDNVSVRIKSGAFHALLGQLKIDHDYELVPGVAHNSALFYKTLGAGAFAYYQKAIGATVSPTKNRP